MIVSNSTVELFFEHLRQTGKKIVCYGAGAALSACFYNLKFYRMEDHTLFICDSDQAKWGTFLELEGKNFEIREPEAMFSLDPTQFVILITCWNTVSVIAALEKYPELNDVECFSANMIQALPAVNVAEEWRKVAENPAFYDYQNILRQLKLKDKHKGERCFIIGNGPSLRADDLEKIKGEVSFAVNYIDAIFDQTAWRPTYYLSGDSASYFLDGEKLSRVDAKYRFLNVRLADLFCRVYDGVYYYNTLSMSSEDNFSQDIIDGVYWSHGVLYSAMQLAAYMGFAEIYLLGVDHQYSKEKDVATGVIFDKGMKDHFYDEPEMDYKTICGILYGKEAQQVARLDLLTQNFKAAKSICEPRGTTIYNATHGGLLEVFPRVDFDGLF